MKKTFFIVLSCCLLICSSCKKEDLVSNTYRAYFEYYIADAGHQQSVETLINNWNSVWKSEIELTLINTTTTDAEAHTKFEVAVAAMVVEQNSWKPFLENNDYMIYTLKRTTSGNEAVLRQVRFDRNGHINL